VGGGGAEGHTENYNNWLKLMTSRVLGYPGSLGKKILITRVAKIRAFWTHYFCVILVAFHFASAGTKISCRCSKVKKTKQSISMQISFAKKQNKNKDL
jgi:hypothetical protein